MTTPTQCPRCGATLPPGTAPAVLGGLGITVYAPQLVFDLFGETVGGPLDPALCLTAQRIVDTAARSAAEKRTLELIP